jgi:hypothetical protein
VVIAIIVGCMPVLPSLYRHIRGAPTASQPSRSEYTYWSSKFSKSASNRDSSWQQQLSSDSEPLQRDGYELDKLGHFPRKPDNAAIVSVEHRTSSRWPLSIQHSNEMDEGVLVSKSFRIESSDRVDRNS